ncbi:hypothetical protein HC928_02620 [bacterium]|nr:hypothetical protein [bacterium]
MRSWLYCAYIIAIAAVVFLAGAAWQVMHAQYWVALLSLVLGGALTYISSLYYERYQDTLDRVRNMQDLDFPKDEEA